MMQKALPVEILKVLKSVEALGFSLCMVGGITRDYFHLQSLGYDYDIEVRPAEGIKISAADWPLYYKKLHQLFKESGIPYKEFPYLITRINIAGTFLEFSSPRIEENIPENTTHHHFVAHLDPNVSYKDSFKRRDFTINAIGVIMNLNGQTESVVDPYNGLIDLKNKTLRHISEDFFYDSVRFLRLIRFSLKFNDFKIEESLLLKIHLFNLSNISIYHFCEELFKSRPGIFLNTFSQLIKRFNIRTADQFIFWNAFTFPEDVLTKEEILAHVYLTAPDKAEQVLKFFSMPEKKLRDLESFMRSVLLLKQLKESDFRVLLLMEKEEAFLSPILKEMKNLDDKKDWSWIIKKDNYHLEVEFRDWQKVEITESEILELKPQSRSLLLFYKAIEKKFCV